MKNRLEHIREQVKNEKKVTVSELSKIYKVTEETIRRDLEKLEKEGFLTRTFGGAVLNSASQKEHIHFYKRTSINQKEKAKIAQLFKEVLDQKRTIAADASTTVMEAIRLLKANRNITVLSSSTEIFREMTGSEIHILSTGGAFNEDSLSLQGNLAKENIRRYHVDLALLSCKGLDMDKGIMDSSEREADVKTEMVKQALEVALLADHTKFERTAFVQFLDWDKVTYLVTDERPSDQWVEFCKEKEKPLHGETGIITNDHEVLLTAPPWVLTGKVLSHPVVTGRNQYLLDAGSVGHLVLRRAEKDDSMEPLGMKGRKRVFQILQEKGIPSLLRREWPVVADEHHIYWTCFLRGSRQGRVTEGTKSFLLLTLTLRDKENE